MEMYRSAKTNLKGPKYCYKLPTHKLGSPSAYISGYIKSFAFDGPATIDVGASDSRFPGSFFRYTFDYKGKLFNEIDGQLRLEADYQGQNPFEINFKVR